jgi:uncharacterized protein (UPF0332 family)
VSFDWTGFYIVADSLVNSPPTGFDEAAFRCAISRAYYAAFCSARDYAISKGVHLSTDGRAHGELVRHYKRAPNQAMNTIGTRLRDLRRNRRDADYTTSITISEAKARASLHDANEVLTLLSGLP